MDDRTISIKDYRNRGGLMKALAMMLLVRSIGGSASLAHSEPVDGFHPAEGNLPSVCFHSGHFTTAVGVTADQCAQFGEIERSIIESERKKYKEKAAGEEAIRKGVDRRLIAGIEQLGYRPVSLSLATVQQERLINGQVNVGIIGEYLNNVLKADGLSLLVNYDNADDATGVFFAEVLRTQKATKVALLGTLTKCNDRPSYVMPVWQLCMIAYGRIKP